MIVKNIRRKPTIGLILPSFYDKYQANICAGIHDQARSQDANVISFVGGSLDFPDSQHVDRNPIYDLINTDMIDALLIMSGSLNIEVDPSGLYQFLTKYNSIPAVSIAVEIPGVSCVLIDNYTGMYDAVSHLIEEHNCNKLAFIRGPANNQEANIRFEAYKQSLIDHGLTFDPQLVYQGRFWHTDGINSIKAFMDERKVAFDAIVGSDDLGVTNAISVLKERGYRVPEDIKLTGFDDIEKSRHCTPPLTTVRQPLFELGSIATKMAIDQFYGNKKPQVKKLKTQLMKRKSCGCNPDVFFNSIVSQSNKSIPTTTGALPSKLTGDILTELKTSYGSHQMCDDIGVIKIKFNQLTYGIIDALQSKSIDNLLRIIEEILSDSYKKELRSSFWINVLQIIIKYIITNTNLIDNFDFAGHLWNNILLTLYRVESRLQAFERLDVIEKHEIVNWLGDKLISCFNMDELKQLLNKELPLLKINSCIFSLYEDVDQKSARLFYCLNDEHDLENKGIIYPSNELLPAELKKIWNKSYIVLPLVTEHKQLGFVIIEETNIDGIIYDTLSEKIAIAIKTANIMQKLNNQTIELEKQVGIRTKELETANQQIIESINYALRIQQAVLPAEERFKMIFKEYVIVWQPRHIVGGDFYWLGQIGENFLLIVADCTGHGIPGAFMSMIGIALLNDLVIHLQHKNPGKFLQELNISLKKTLNRDQYKKTTNEGMDLAACFISPKEKKLIFSGAKRPLFYCKNNEMHMIKGDRQSLGYIKSCDNFVYKNHEIPLSGDESFFLFTDGITDQNGGTKNLPFGKSRLKNLLIKNQHLPLRQQYNIIKEDLLEYMGNETQRDDITVVGFKVNMFE